MIEESYRPNEFSYENSGGTAVPAKYESLLGGMNEDNTF